MEQFGETHDMIVTGTAIVPVYGNDDKPTTHFREHQMTPELAENFIGCGVFIEHDTEASEEFPNKQIGTIVHAEIDSMKRLKTYLHITGNEYNKLLPSRLYNDPEKGRFFKDLSVGTTYGFNIDPDTKKLSVESSKLTECSLVCTGDSEGCHIDGWNYIDKNITDVRSHILENRNSYIYNH